MEFQQPSNSTSRCVTKRTENRCSNKHSHTRAHCSSIHDSQQVQTGRSPNSRRMDKHSVVYVYQEVLLSPKKEWRSVMHYNANEHGEFCKNKPYPPLHRALWWPLRMTLRLLVRCPRSSAPMSSQASFLVVPALLSSPGAPHWPLLVFSLQLACLTLAPTSGCLLPLSSPLEAPFLYRRKFHPIPEVITPEVLGDTLSFALPHLSPPTPLENYCRLQESRVDNQTPLPGLSASLSLLEGAHTVPRNFTSTRGAV